MTRYSLHVRRRARALLLGIVPLLPGLALAALATHDLAGAARKAPVTMGALEAGAAAVEVATPVGLVLTVHRIAD